MIKISDILERHEEELKNGIVTQELKDDIKEYELEYNNINIIEYKTSYRCMWLSLMIYITNENLRSKQFKLSIIYYLMCAYPQIGKDLDKETIYKISQEQFNNAKNELCLDLDFNNYKNILTVDDLITFIDRLDGDQ